MADHDAGWRLRKILQTEPRIILLASATSRFDQIDNPDQALYDLFRVLPLRPLETQECADLWKRVTGQDVWPDKIRALQILIGGSPRLFVIFARFGADLSFRKLMVTLFDLVDDHTEYFKNHFDMIAAQERRVYLALADLWKPVTTKEIAGRARLETSKCSAQLARLVKRGSVQVSGGTAQRKQYYLTERLYNIYYLLRRPRGPDRLVESLVRFMEAYYSPPELKEMGAKIAHESGSLDIRMLRLQQTALAHLLKLSALAEYREELLEMIPTDFLEDLDLELVALGETGPEWTDVEPDPRQADQFNGDDSDASAEMVGRELLEEGDALRKQNRLEEALAVYDEVVRRFGESERLAIRRIIAIALTNKGIALSKLNRPEESLVVFDEIVRRFGESEAPDLLELVAKAFANKGEKLITLDRLEEALAVSDEVVRRFGESKVSAVRGIVAIALTSKGFALSKLNRLEETLAVSDEIVRRFGEGETLAAHSVVAGALLAKGVGLVVLNRPEESLVVFDEIVRRFGESEAPDLLEPVADAFLYKGGILGVLDRLEEALAVFDEVVRRFGERTSPPYPEMTERALLEKAHIELEFSRHEAAIRTAGRVLEQRLTEAPENRLRGHLIHAKATFASGDPLGCDQDIEEILAILPKLDYIPNGLLDALMRFSIKLGPARVLEFIQASPSANLLLPLTTALEQELGFEPRVALEVEEVARDIQDRLQDLRNG